MLVAADESGDPGGLGIAHLALGVAWEASGDIDQAADAYAEAIPRMTGVDGLRGVRSSPRQSWQTNSSCEGDLEAGVPMLEDALARFRQLDPPWFIVLVMNTRGHAALLQSDLLLAAHLFSETIEMARGLPQTGWSSVP